MKQVLLTIAFLVFCSSGFSQSPEEMKAWQQSMAPGEYHKWLSTFNGTWNGEVKMWMDPSQPPVSSKMITVNEMTMNNLFQRSTHIGNMMGMEFKGEGLVGYDNVKKMFTSTWIDNMGSSITYMTGKLGDDKKILTMNGSMAEPMSGENMIIKQVLTLLSEDKHTFEMFMVVEGKDIKTMEIIYTRKK